MAELEKYIDHHRDEFDADEPSAGHFDRFALMLDEVGDHQPQLRAGAGFLKIAAIILLFICAGAFVVEFAAKQVMSRFSSPQTSSVLSREITDAMLYYDNQSSDQMAVLQSLTKGHPDAVSTGKTVLAEIQNLDNSARELKNSLLENPGNERIEAALIQNRQMKNVILNTVITQMSDRSRQ